MRDILLAAAMLFYYVPLSAAFPALGVISWEWFSLTSPQREVYGFAEGMRLNLVIAIATLVGWLISRERKRWTPDALPWVLLIFVIWTTFNGFLSPVPEQNWFYWNQIMRSLVVVFLVFFLMTKKARIQGMIWTIVISLGYYGVKGGLFTIWDGGHAIVYGPPNTIITDNNQLALAIVMSLPLVFYLWRYTQKRLLRFFLAIAIGLQIVMVFGSYSRGGVIALSAMLIMFWLRNDRKIVYGVVGAVIVAAALSVMPDSFWSRLNTLNNVGADTSFQGRLAAWHVAFAYASEHFPFGAGFYVPQVPFIFNRYEPGGGDHAAHSIYFQILGEQGFVGIAIYVTILLFAVRNATVIVSRTRGKPELAWAHDLADMIRVSMFAYFVGGAALSMAYFDGFFVLLALTSTLRELVVPRRVALGVGISAGRGMLQPSGLTQLGLSAPAEPQRYR
jgi:putative inorganic carbon (hco3(-)) transporter